MDRILTRHKLLLTTISDDLGNSGHECDNFIEHMKGYVPRGLLSSKKSLLDKFDALAVKGFLKPGKYDVLKEISEHSGNQHITELVEEAERDIILMQQRIAVTDTKPKSTFGSSVSEEKEFTPTVKLPTPGHEYVMQLMTGTRSMYSESGFMSKVETSKRKIRDDVSQHNDTKIARVESVKVLTNVELNELCTRKGRTSTNVMERCTRICSIIQDMSKEIIHVYPAYNLSGKNKIVFVVFAKRDIDIKFNWEVRLNISHQSNEDIRRKVDMFNKNYCPLPLPKAKELSDIIDKHAFNLMKQHKYLSAITAGSEKGDDASVRAFIIVYVLVKHFIPLNEEPFPTEIEGIRVVVREGEFQLCGRSANQYQDKLRMGCRITSSKPENKFGTLGGFIEHPIYGLCGFTCAHVFMNDSDKERLKANGKIKSKEMPDRTVYQPSVSFGNEVGSLVEMVYKEGGGEGGKPGVDLALFKVERRSPIDGTFPEVRENATDSTYRSGYVWGKEGISSGHTRVQKFGQVTEQTHGNIEFDNAVVKEIDFHSYMSLPAYRLTTTLYKQYHIKSVDGVAFCKTGDSGALVFMRDTEQNDLRCIGMVVGVVDDTECFVTPISAILEELNVPQLKPFNPNVTWELIEGRLLEMENRLKNAFTAQIKQSTTMTNNNT